MSPGAAITDNEVPSTVAGEQRRDIDVCPGNEVRTTRCQRRAPGAGAGAGKRHESELRHCGYVRKY